MNLLIVESPAKAKTIEKYLGKEFKVLATIGHIIDLPSSKLAVDIDNKYAPEFEVMKDKKKIVSALKKAIPKDGDVYLAMDPDREGEAIAYHTSQALKIKKGKRVTFNEITKNAVNEAIKSPREVDMSLVNAQFARRVLDRLVGYKVSGVLWKKVRYGLSAGRVQSVALRLIVEREMEIINFIPVEYWEVFSNIKNKSTNLKVQLEKINNKKPVIKNKEEVDKIYEIVNKAKYEAIDVNERQRSVGAIPPYTTSTLQQSANNILGYTAKRTMQLAQSLYQKGYITYMRTDSFSLSEDAIVNIRNYIGNSIGGDYLPPKPNYYKNRAKNSQEAHEAIRPTDVNQIADMLKDCTPQEKKLYEIIHKRTVSCQMKDYIAKVVNVKFIPQGESSYQFSAQAQKTIFLGFRKVWNYSLQEDTAVQEINDIKKGDIFDLVSVDTIQNFTKPKSRYTEATLVKMLEKLGVGRPSTYATIISTVQERGYVVKEEKKLKPTDVGIVVNKFISTSFPRLVDYSYTAKVEGRLDNIINGKDDYFSVIDSEYKPLVDEISYAEKNVNKEDLVVLEKSEEKCPECGKEMLVKIGKYGKFLSCSDFPTCKGMKSIEESIDIKIEENKYVENNKCPKCGKDMQLKSGRYGTYWSCIDNPKCKGVLPLILLEKCPECNSNLVERKGRWGKTFVGCSGYPNCNYIKGAKKKTSVKRKATKKTKVKK